MAASPPAGCSTSHDGKFQVSIYSRGEAKRSVEKRACEGEGTLVMTLKDGVLKDSHDRTGYIASNYQFQFDGPPQANALKSSGFSLCQNGSLALDVPQAPTKTAAPPAPPVSQISDGQIQGPPKTAAPPPPVSQISDGQPQAPTHTEAPPPPVSQISDGQPQAPTHTQAPPPPVTQISDGQPQAPTNATTKAPTAVPTAAANKAFPGVAAAVFALFGAVLYL
ncbi:Cell wall mannoprotein CIS3 [Metarhizium anisopliae]